MPQVWKTKGNNLSADAAYWGGAVLRQWSSAFPTRVVTATLHSSWYVLVRYIPSPLNERYWEVLSTAPNCYRDYIMKSLHLTQKIAADIWAATNVGEQPILLLVSLSRFVCTTNLIKDFIEVPNTFFTLVIHLAKLIYRILEAIYLSHSGVYWLSVELTDLLQALQHPNPSLQTADTAAYQLFHALDPVHYDKDRGIVTASRRNVGVLKGEDIDDMDGLSDDDDSDTIDGTGDSGDMGDIDGMN